MTPLTWYQSCQTVSAPISLFCGRAKPFHTILNIAILRLRHVGVTFAHTNPIFAWRGRANRTPWYDLICCDLSASWAIGAMVHSAMSHGGQVVVHIYSGTGDKALVQNIISCFLTDKYSTFEYSTNQIYGCITISRIYNSILYWYIYIYIGICITVLWPNGRMYIWIKWNSYLWKIKPHGF